MKPIIMFISALLLHSVAIASTSNRINGVIVDNYNKTPLIGVAIILLDEASKQVMGTTTDEKGHFELTDITTGEYTLQCSYVGYNKFTIVLKQLEKSIDLGIIKMRQGTVVLDEVEVQGDLLLDKIDRQLVIPTSAQKKAATNGVRLLQYLQLPNITVNSINNSISTNFGETVQLYINGIKVTQAEIMAISPEDVIRIEYHKQPGMRYGGASAVLDYIIKNRESGGNILANLTNSIYPLGYGEYQVSGKFYHKKSSFSALMKWSRRDLEWNRENEEVFYFPDKKIINKETVASPNRVKYDYITTSLNYNYVNREKSMLNIALRSNTKDTPHSFTDRNSILYQDDKKYEVKDREKSRSHIPSLDIYYQLNMNNNQHLYFDIVGTYLKSDNMRTYSLTESTKAPSTIFSKTEGNKYSIIGEAIYERPLLKGKLTTGIKHNQASMNNIYQGNVSSKVTMNTAESSIFAEYQSKVGKLNYLLGLGMMRTYYKQENMTQEKYFIKPTLNISYQLGKLSLRYNATISGYAPSLAELSNVVQPMDIFQVRKGNPNLKSVTYFSNHILGSYRINKLMNLDLSARYSFDKNPIMEETFYENNMFIRTYNNQKGLHRLHIQSNIKILPLKKHLSINLNPFFNRYISIGNNYIHTHSNIGFRGSFLGMYKNIIMMVDIKTSNHNLFGETITKGESTHTISIGYNKQKWAIQMLAMNPFTKKYHQEIENISKLAPNKQLAFSNDLCPMFMVNVSFNLSYGKQNRGNRQRISNEDNDIGILTGTK